MRTTLVFQYKIKYCWKMGGDAKTYIKVELGEASIQDGGRGILGVSVVEYNRRTWPRESTKQES